MGERKGKEGKEEEREGEREREREELEEKRRRGKEGRKEGVLSYSVCVAESVKKGKREFAQLASNGISSFNTA